MNIIDAIINLVTHPILELEDATFMNNRANNMGKALEDYVKDLFANSLECDTSDKLKRLEKTFSYLGNNNNPPDAMLFNGDAIEIKKIENMNSFLSLNSSYPKKKLLSTNNMLNESCRKAEIWDEKDIIYVVGVVSGKKLKHLCFNYGEDYAANQEVYKKIKNTIKCGIENIHGVEFANTKELGRINRVDPLGITYLRVRGMWGMENPWNVFDYIYKRDLKKKFNFMCIINQEKWNKLTNAPKLLKLTETIEGLSVNDVKIKNPDNPSRLKDAKLIKFTA
ncbi:MAG: NgoPII family restriction endonuclease [Erysipelotrichaceae bacterium]